MIKNMKTVEMMVYEAPQVRVVEVEVEKGFAASAEPANFRFGGHFGDEDE